MGDWRTVHIVGTCKADEVPALSKACECGDDDYDNFHCLSYNERRPSLCGLFKWPSEKINAIGNLAERDFGIDDVSEQLKKLVVAAPSLDIKVHCGGSYEDKKVVSTVTAKDGVVTVGPPEQEVIAELSQEHILGRFMMASRRF